MSWHQVCVVGVGVEVGDGESAEHTEIIITKTLISGDLMRTKGEAIYKNIHVVWCLPVDSGHLNIGSLPFLLLML